VGFKAVVEPRGARRGLSKRSDVCGLSNEEMLLAYDELEREMCELRNNIRRRINPNDPEALHAWRERVESARSESYSDIEKRASQLAEAAGRVRDRQYASASVIGIAPMRETEANANARDAHKERINAIAHRGSSAREANTATSRVETNIVKKEKSEASDGDANTRWKEPKVKSTSSASSSESSETDDSTKKSTEKKKHRSGKHFKNWLVLEKFDGTTPLSIFLNQLETCVRYNC